MRPVFTKRSQLQSKCVHAKLRSNFLPAASRTRSPSGITSCPMPSPSMTAMLYFFKSTPRNNDLAGSLLAEQRHEFIQSSSRIDRLYKRNQTIGLLSWPFGVFCATDELRLYIRKRHWVRRT